MTILQNYICTSDYRFNLVKSYFPTWKKQFSKYKFIVNYNSTINYEKIQNLYKENIQDYELVNNLEKDWGKTTLKLVNNIDTKYTLILIEDFEVINSDLNYLTKVLEEVNDSCCNYVLMHKLKKYTSSHLIKNYEEKNEIYTCEWDKYPASCLSVVGIFDTDLLKKILIHYVIQNRTLNVHGIHTPNNFEDFYSNWNNNYMKIGLPFYLNQFNIKIKAAIPKKDIIFHNEGVQQIKQREVFLDRDN
jgi:hypothetical protein